MIKFQNTDINKIFVGSDSIQKAYLGSNLLWTISDTDLNYIELSAGQYFNLNWNISSAYDWQNSGWLGVEGKIRLLEDSLKTTIWFAANSGNNNQIGSIFEGNQIRTCGFNRWPSAFYVDITPNTDIEFKMAIRNPQHSSLTGNNGKIIYNNTLVQTENFSASGVYFSSENMCIGGTTNVNGGMRIYSMDFNRCVNLYKDSGYDNPTYLHKYIPVLHAGTPCLKDTITNTYIYHSGGGTLIYG